MDDPASVGLRERVRYLRCDRQGLEELDPAVDAKRQRLAFQVLHHDEAAIRVATHLVDRADVGVVQSGGGLGFRDEALPRVLVRSGLGREELQGDLAPEGHVLREVDLSHAARAEPTEHPVVRNDLSDLGEIVSGH